jgi:hypothetical protein
MSMYVTLLSGALDLWDVDFDEDALLDHARDCRAALSPRHLGSGVMSGTALAAEISYDRALVCLAAQRGIDVTPTNFMHPRIERERLELALADLGVDLETPARHTDNLGDA